MVRLSVIAALALVGWTQAQAADWGAPDMPNAMPPLNNEVPLELGTGWYLRGDVGYAREQTPKLFVDTTVAGAQLLNATGARNGWSAGLGFGYKLNNWFRTDFTYEVRNTMNADASSAAFNCQNSAVGLSNAAGTAIGIGIIYGRCTASQTANLTRSVTMANGYFDLGTFAGVTPYVGVGVGMVYGATAARYNWNNASDGSPYNPTLTMPSSFPLVYYHLDPSGALIAGQPVTYGAQSKLQVVNSRSFALAWALMAGFSYDLTGRAKIDIGYRYLNMGTGSKITPSSVAKASDVRVGFRYMID